ncbi:MAG: phosphatidylglycerophosphatase A [Arenicella sp.]|nr:phosphatidylglycerophosphatase A [Arenicella sp.]
MTQNAKFKLSNPVHFLALGFGSGLIKPAPGTWGTLAAVPLYLLIVSFVSTSSYAYFGIILFSFVIGIYLCGKTAADAGVHDHGSIVWDEIVGFFITMALLPVTWQNVVLGFILFRLFDIVKPWPIKLLDKHVHGGFGIMIDDVLAGVFAWVLLFFAQPYLA